MKNYVTDHSNTNGANDTDQVYVEDNKNNQSDIKQKNKNNDKVSHSLRLPIPDKASLNPVLFQDHQADQIFLLT